MMDELDAIEKEMGKESKDLKRTRFFALTKSSDIKRAMIRISFCFYTSSNDSELSQNLCAKDISLVII